MSTEQDQENPWTRVEAPVTVKLNDRMHEEKTTHPAFGHIQANRCTGQTSLYGSDFPHHAFIKITISHSEMYRGLSKDWMHQKDDIVEVNLSEAQWATFVSSLNASGTQCTLRHINRKPIPMLPDPESRTDQFKNEASETTQEAAKNLKELAELIAESNLSGVKKKELLTKVMFAQRAIGSSVEFVLKQFGEHMEKTTEKAKIEIEAYINNRIQKAGLDALSGKPFEMISDQSKD